MAVHVTCIGETEQYSFFKKRPRRLPTRGFEDNMTFDIISRVRMCNGLRCFSDSFQCRAFVNTVMNLGGP
jgi:hypothetical protein